MSHAKVSLVASGSSNILKYDPAKGLETIAVAEAGEKHFARAKNAAGLHEAIKAKLLAQAEYVVWRDATVVHGRPHNMKKIAVLRSFSLPPTDPGAKVAHRWRERLCTRQAVDYGKIEAVARRLVTVIDAEKMRKANDDAAKRATRICEQEKDGTVRGTEGTGEFERYTPAHYIETARQVLGEIDLDPATSALAQKTVRAAKYFTSTDDGLAREWHGRVWLNPPYHRDLAPAFINKLVGEVGAGRVTAAIMLTNNCTDTAWFTAATSICAAVCFTHGRIRFTQPNGDEVLPTQGQAFFYYGPDTKLFCQLFAMGPNAIGHGMLPYNQGHML